MENIPPEPPPTTYTNEPVSQQGSFQRPADYYATPPEKNRGCGKGAVIGCGLAGCLVLVLMFVGGAMLMRGGMGRILDFALAQLDKEAVSMMSSDVTPQQRAEFQNELALFRRNAREKRVELAQIQPILQQLSETSGDNVLTPNEVTALIDAMREANSRATAPR